MFVSFFVSLLACVLCLLEFVFLSALLRVMHVHGIGLKVVASYRTLSVHHVIQYSFILYKLIR